MAEEDESAPPKEIKIPHKRSKQFSSQFATGALASGPTPDGMIHLIFYSDAVGIESETGVLVSQEGDQVSYQGTVKPGDIVTFREDKVRVSMTLDVLRSVYDMIKTRLEVLEKMNT